MVRRPGGSALVSIAAVAAALALAGAAGPAAPTGGRGLAPQQPTLTLDSATVNASWKESWLTGNVVYGGTVSAPSELTASLRRVDPPPTRIVADATFTANPTTYSESLELPNRALPGTYVLRVRGESEGVELPPVETTITIPTPPEGVVDKWAISLKSGGPPVRRVKGPVRQLFARFHFAVPPTGPRVVRLVWRTPQFNFVGEARKPWQESVETFLRSTRPLPKGTWYCLLTVNEIVTKRIRVRIT